MDRLNPLYASRKLEGKKLIALVVGSKKKEEYMDQRYFFIQPFLKSFYFRDYHS